MSNLPCKAVAQLLWIKQDRFVRFNFSWFLLATLNASQLQSTPTPYALGSSHKIVNNKHPVPSPRSRIWYGSAAEKYYGYWNVWWLKSLCRNGHLTYIYCIFLLCKMTWWITRGNWNQLPICSKNLEISNDKKTIAYHLREEAIFSDGTPITAEDVIWSFNFLIKINPMMKQYYKDTSKVEAVNQHTVKFYSKILETKSSLEY